MEDMDTPIAPEKSGGDSTIALFLGLYLVVLAFFILLVTISDRKSTRLNSSHITISYAVFCLKKKKTIKKKKKKRSNL